jgi:hypothetical protein
MKNVCNLSRSTVVEQRRAQAQGVPFEDLAETEEDD